MSQKKGLMSDKTFNLFITSACVALAVLTLFLAWQNRKLNYELAEMHRPQIPPEALKEGDAMEPLSVLDEAGMSVTLRFGDAEGKTLLLLFSPECPACAATLPIWSELFREPPESTRIIGLRLGAEPQQGLILPFTVYTPDERDSGLAGKIPYVPTTLLVDGHGIVERIWYGVLQKEDQKDLLRRLGGP